MSAAIASLPAASAVYGDSVAKAPSAPSAPLTVDEIVEQLKDRTAAELFKIIKEATKYGEKASKNAASPKKGTRKSAAKKDSDVPLSPEEAEKAAKRGAQLDKPRAWVTFVGNDARAHGWSAFPAKVTAKDKVTGEKAESIVEMPESKEQEDGKHVFPDGKAFNHKHAMSLSKAYWVAKTKEGSRQDLYAEFEAQYVAPVRGAASAAATSDAEEETEAEPEAPSAAPAPAPAHAKPKETKPKKVTPKLKKATDEWVAPTNGKFAPWTFNGRAVRRNKDNYVVGKDVDGEDEWLGYYNPKTNEIEECDVPEDFTA